MLKSKNQVVMNALLARNEKVVIGDRVGTTAPLKFAKDRQGNYVLKGDTVTGNVGDGVDSYEVLEVMDGGKLRLGELGTSVGIVPASTCIIQRKHRIIRKDGDRIVLANSAIMNASSKTAWTMFVNNHMFFKLLERGKADSAKEMVLRFEKAIESLSKFVPSVRIDYSSEIKDAKDLIRRFESARKREDWSEVNSLEKEASAIRMKYNRPATESVDLALKKMSDSEKPRISKPTRRTSDDDWLD